jgi:WD40 repeat protein
VELVVANLYSSPLTLLYGPSGVGKSSLLMAGVVPRLRSRGDFHVLVCNCAIEDPLESLRAALAAAAGRRVAFILDQFEDYFVRWERDERFADELAEALAARDVLSVLIAIREESLAKLDRVEDRLPGVFETVLRLEYLDRDAARAAVEGALEVWNARRAPEERVELGKGLLNGVLDAIAAGDDPELQHVETAHLQLVMERVWEVERERRSHVLHSETLADLGGPEGIVRAHVGRALSALTRREQTLAADMLDRLVTPTGESFAQSTAALAGWANVDDMVVRPVLERLAQARIVRPAADDRWRIYHEVLASAVLEWRSKFVTNRRLAEQRRRYLSVGALLAVGIAVTTALAVYAWLQRQTARSQALTAEARVLLATDPREGLVRALLAYNTKQTSSTQAVLREAVGRSLERESAVADPTGDVHAVAFVAGGRQIVTGGDDGRVRFWSSSLQSPVRSVRLVDDAVVADVEPCGREIVAATSSGARRVGSGPSTGPLGPNTPAVAVGCSSDGRVVAVADANAVYVFDAKRRWPRRLPYPVPGHSCPRVPRAAVATSVAVSGDGGTIAVAGEAGGVLWSRGGGLPKTLCVPVGTSSVKLASVAFEPAGAHLVTGGSDGEVRVWSLAGELRRVLSGHEQEVRAVTYSSDGALIASAAADDTIRIWDAASGDILDVLRGHRAAVTSVAFAPDDSALVSGGEDGSVRRWTNPVQRELRAGRPEETSVAFGGAGRLLVAWSQSSGVTRVWRPQPTREAAAPPPDRAGLLSVRLSAESNVLVTLGSEGNVRVFRLGDRLVPVAVKASADAVAVTRDGTKVALASKGTIRVLDLHTREVRTAARASGPPAIALALDPAGRRAAVATLDDVHVFDLASGRRPLVLPAAASHDLEFAAAGRQVVTVGDEGRTQIWDARTGRLASTLAGHEGAVLTAATSSDSRLVVTAGQDGTVRFWDVATHSELQALRLHGSAAAFAADGRSIAVAGPGSTVRVYACRFCGPIADVRRRARRDVALPGVSTSG